MDDWPYRATAHGRLRFGRYTSLDGTHAVYLRHDPNPASDYLEARKLEPDQSTLSGSSRSKPGASDYTTRSRGVPMPESKESIPRRIAQGFGIAFAVAIGTSLAALIMVSIWWLIYKIAISM